MRRSRRVAALAVALLAVGVVVAGSPTRSVATTSGNLIVNGNAEASHRCSSTGKDAMMLPGWTVVEGNPDVVCYGAPGFPTRKANGPANRGTGFFDGGATGNALIRQRVNVSAAATAIDAGGVTCHFSGWLGGYSTQTDFARLVIRYKSGSGAKLGAVSLATVSPASRQNKTELLQVDQPHLTVPAGARSIVVSVRFVHRSGDVTDGYADNITLGLSTPMPAPHLTRPMSMVPKFDHVFVVYMENENAYRYEAPAATGHYIFGSGRGPYLNKKVAAKGATLTSMYATTHPSDPNYLALSGGTTFDREINPPVGSIHGKNLGDTIQAAGKTWKGYADGMHGNCDKANHNSASGGYYLFDEEPFMLYADVADHAQRCARHNQPGTRFFKDLKSAKTTPNFVWFAANDYQDMEGGGVAVGDKWLSHELPHIFSSPAWKKQRSLLIVTWDEGYTKAFGPSYPNHVAAYVLASKGMVNRGAVSNHRYTQFSLGSTIDHALGLPALTTNDRYAEPINDIWR